MIPQSQDRASLRIVNLDTEQAIADADATLASWQWQIAAKRYGWDSPKAGHLHRWSVMLSGRAEAMRRRDALIALRNTFALLYARCGSWREGELADALKSLS